MKSAYDIVYKVQCKTFAIARKLSNENRDACSMSEYTNPPFCLRIKKELRTPKMQEFRNKVAQHIVSMRIGE